MDRHAAGKAHATTQGVRMSFPTDSPREACGIVGAYLPGEDVARITFFGLHALQHRGQESAGIATGDGKQIRVRKAMGLITQAFDEVDLSTLTGYLGIGHTRYSTTGSSNIENAQPITSSGPDGELAIAHNGNIVNALSLRDELEGWGLEFKSSSDSEVIAHLMTNAPAPTLEERIAYSMRRLEGAYSLTMMTKDAVYGIRDPLGVRPLCIGKLNGGWVIASETCALDQIGAEYIRDVHPGEAVVIDAKGLRTVYRRISDQGRRPCMFEHIYMARADSFIEGRQVYDSRKAMGAELARQYPVEADMVIGVPDSGTPAAVGYAEESGIPFGEGLIKNRYVGRTFILPDQRLRDMGVRMKYNPLLGNIKDKRLVVVDDTIVRGTTQAQVVTILRRGGAKEVHLRISAPPIKHPCHLGVDFPTRSELLAFNKSVDEIRDYVGADSLGYLSTPRLLRAVGTTEERSCMACFTGNQPIPVQLEMDKLALEV
jgi:amidophosphoribosyltransferase